MICLKKSASTACVFCFVFDNWPSPDVATYGLRKTVESSDLDVQIFVSDNLYVDDGPTSLPSHQAVDLMKQTQNIF